MHCCYILCSGTRGEIPQMNCFCPLDTCHPDYIHSGPSISALLQNGTLNFYSCLSQHLTPQAFRDNPIVYIRKWGNSLLSVNESAICDGAICSQLIGIQNRSSILTGFLNFSPGYDIERRWLLTLEILIKINWNTNPSIWHLISGSGNFRRNSSW